MRFRSKIVLGVALIESILLAVLVLSALGWLTRSNEIQLQHRAYLTERLLVAAARDPMIGLDIAGLRSLGEELVETGEIAYVRFLDERGRVLTGAGQADILARPFREDTSLTGVDDQVLDRRVALQGTTSIYGQVQFGIPISRLQAFMEQARHWAISLTLVEIALVIVLSVLLAGWLTRRLAQLRHASAEIAMGNLAHRLDERGGDELADTARAFNIMSERLRVARKGEKEAMEAMHQVTSFQRALLESSDSAIIVTDTAGVIVRFNPAAEAMLGYRAEEVIGHATPDLFLDPAEARVHAELISKELGIDSALGFEAMLTLGRHGLSDRHEWTFISKAGARIPILAAVSGVYDEPGMLLGFMGVIQDISALKRADERMREAARVFEASADAIMITDARGRILAVNPAFNRITGHPARAAVGRRPDLLRSNRHPASFYRHLWRALRAQGRWEGEIWNRRANGEEFPAWMTISTVQDRNGHIIEYIALFSDITERKQAEEEIRKRALYDSLTGLPNRNLLDEHLDHAMREVRRLGEKLAVMFIDLDHFKSINDTLGHAMGDLLLKQAAARLAGDLRDTDTLSRQGGDEFVLVLQGVHQAQDAARVAGKMIDSLSRPFDLDGHQANIGASIGITLYPDDAHERMALFRNADLAMYRAKAAGRNTFQFYESSMTEEALRRRELEIDLRRALESDSGELSLHYQAIVEFDSLAPVGAEALVRWHHPVRGEIAPERFIPLAEDTGLIHALGRWVIATACRERARLRDEYGLALPFAVNLSSRQVPGGLTIEELRHLLAQHRLAGSDIAFEITESMLLGDLPDIHAWLDAARALGLRISLDDFGTGYSSLAYLKRFTIDRIKVDRSFVRDMTSDHDDMTLIQGILAMAHGLRLEVIAEGIENEAQRQALWRMGCDYGQGYLFAPPLPLAAFAERARTLSGHLRAGQTPGSWQ